VSRRLERVDVAHDGTTFNDLLIPAVGHKFEVLGWSSFLVASTGTVYLGVLKEDTTFWFIDQLNWDAARYVRETQFSGYSIYNGEVLQCAFSGTGFAAGSVTIEYVDVDFT
jgi:hypothetical protein